MNACKTKVEKAHETEGYLYHPCLCVHLTSSAAAITLTPKTESIAGFIRLSITHTHPYSDVKNTTHSPQLSDK